VAVPNLSLPQASTVDHGQSSIPVSWSAEDLLYSDKSQENAQVCGCEAHHQPQRYQAVSKRAQALLHPELISAHSKENQAKQAKKDEQSKAQAVRRV